MMGTVMTGAGYETVHFASAMVINDGVAVREMRAPQSEVRK